MTSPAYIKDYIDRVLCRFSQIFLAKLADATSGETGPDADISEPAMTKAELAAATGIPVAQSSIYLTDATGAARYAWRNVNDTTSAASSTIIVDGDGVRWYIMSLREVLNGFVNNFSPFP